MWRVVALGSFPVGLLGATTTIHIGEVYAFKRSSLDCRNSRYIIAKPLGVSDSISFKALESTFP